VTLELAKYVIQGALEGSHVINKRLGIAMPAMSKAQTTIRLSLYLNDM
jgi:hypothetical protein